MKVSDVKWAILWLALSSSANAEILTVQQVKELHDRDAVGKVAATSYSTGVFDGLLAMEALRRTERGEATEFCGVYDAHRRGQPIRHPAFRTRELIREWERQGRSMELPYHDLALNFLSATYGCKK
jgi:hypothetical protein